MENEIRLTNLFYFITGMFPEERKEFTAVIQKKTKETPEETVTWQNYKRATVDRQALENVMRTEGGVIGKARDAGTEKECFSLFFDTFVIR